MGSNVNMSGMSIPGGNGNKKAELVIVEDEVIVAMDISKRLRSLGYGIAASFTTAEKCISRLAELNPDLILMDINLKGGMDGISAAQLIRGNFNIPVVFLTAHNDENTLQRAKVTEPYGYILKPFEIRDLRNNIEISLYRHSMEMKLMESERRYREQLQERFEEQKKITALIIEKLEEERLRISRELHDSIGQMLFAVKFNIEALAKTSGLQEEPRYSEILRMLTDTNRELKSIIYSLHPVVLENYGLKAAVEKFLGEFSLSTGLKTDFSCDYIERFDIKKELNIFRIIQEAVTNIAKHSGADRASIKISISDENSLFIEIHDNGCGIIRGEEGKQPGFGIKNMQQRVDMTRGKMSIGTNEQNGTKISIEVPL